MTVRYQAASLSVSIDDARSADVSPPVEPAHDGRGLVGMRQRVALFRGTFSAEPTRTGFRVHAELPIGSVI